MCKRKWKNGKFWQLFHDDGKEQRQGKSVTPSAAVWLRQNQQKACFPSISPVFVHFNFSINCPLCKEVGCSRGKSAGNLHRRAIESSRWVPIFNTVQCCRIAWKPQIDTDINQIYSNISIKYTQISIESRNIARIANAVQCHNLLSGKQLLSWIQALNCQNCNQCLKCHLSLGLSLSLCSKEDRKKFQRGSKEVPKKFRRSSKEVPKNFQRSFKEVSKKLSGHVSSSLWSNVSKVRGL